LKQQEQQQQQQLQQQQQEKTKKVGSSSNNVHLLLLYSSSQTEDSCAALLCFALLGFGFAVGHDFFHSWFFAATANLSPPNPFFHFLTSFATFFTQP
jgi:hypothetical protein